MVYPALRLGFIIVEVSDLVDELAVQVLLLLRVLGLHPAVPQHCVFHGWVFNHQVELPDSTLGVFFFCLFLLRLACHSRSRLVQVVARQHVLVDIAPHFGSLWG